MVGNPAGSGKHDSKNKEIRCHDPFDFVDINAERGHDLWQTDIHDRGVQHSHERPDHDIGENPPPVGFMLVMKRGEPVCESRTDLMVKQRSHQRPRVLTLTSTDMPGRSGSERSARPA